MKNIKNELYYFNIPYRNCLKLPDDVRFGIEIEFNMKNYNNYEGKLSIAQDLMKQKNYNYSYNICIEQKNQIELVSEVLKDDEKTWDELQKVLSFIISNDGYCNDKNGAHVHICENMFNINPKGWLNFFKLWSVFEEDIFMFTNGFKNQTRIGAKLYARIINDICKTIINDFNIFNYINVSALKNSKRYCINFNRLLYTSNKEYIQIKNIDDYNVLNTIEFRSPNGTLSNIVWQNNINFFINLLLSCSDNNFDVEKMNFLYDNKNLSTEFDLIDLVYKDELDKMCFLKQYYKIK